MMRCQESSLSLARNSYVARSTCTLHVAIIPTCTDRSTCDINLCLILLLIAAAAAAARLQLNESVERFPEEVHANPSSQGSIR